jgi:glycosyltransferase involved in cell wall biosynthesis
MSEPVDRSANPAPAPSVSLLHITTVPMSLTFLKGQVGYMKAQGIEVHALSSPGEDLLRFGATEGVGVSAVVMPRRVTPLRDLWAVRGILRELRRLRPTIVHAHTPKGGLLGMIAAWVHRAPIRIYHMRGLPLMGATGWRRALLWSTEWIACRLAHQVLCVSHSVRTEAIASGICPPDRIKVLLGGSGNGVDARDRFDPERQGERGRRDARERHGIPQRATVIGFVGRLVRDKGIIELAQAWESLRGRYPDLHLLLVGPFEPQDPVPAQVERSLREDARVHLAGMDWDTPPLYAAMDLVALPTYREGFPNVPLEAAAMALPVVATEIPGCIDAVAHGVTGMLVPPRDPAALTGALLRYVQDPDLRLLHGAAARERVLRDFRQEAIWEAIHTEYRRLLQGTLPPPRAGVADRVRAPLDAGTL